MTTAHSPSCSRVFKNYDKSCPRCIELANGASARSGWSHNRKAAEAQRNEQIRRFFAPGGRYSQMSDIEKMTCTAFEW